MTDTIPQRMRVEVCPVCSLTYSFPLDFYLARLKDHGPIHCPAGHAVKPADDKALANTNAVLLSLALQSEIRQLKAELERTRAIITRMPQPPEGPISDKEYDRRIQLLTNRAERSQYGKTLCRFCGKEKKSSGLMRSHLRTVHRDEILQLAAIYFD